MSDHFVVVAKHGCGWCGKACDLLEDHSKTYDYFNVTDEYVLREFIRALGFTTVPQIWHNGVLIPNGYEGLKAYLNMENLD